MIRTAVNQLYKVIKEANGELENIRKNCSHKETRIGLYSWRVGAVQKGVICCACDKMISSISESKPKFEPDAVIG